LIFATGAETRNVFFSRNFHVVTPGRVYRCAQPQTADLKQLVQAYAIRSVINLRGCCDPAPQYLEESRATHHLALAQYDICLSAGRLPAVHEMRRLVEVLDRAEYPLVLHCRRGADRTGMASAVVQLLQGDITLNTARRQLSLRYGHLALGRPAYLDQFLDFYEHWLQQQGREHSADLFRHWLLEEYCPGACRCVVEPLDCPPRLPRGEPVSLRVRARNTGLDSWRFRPGTNAGVHAGFVVWDPQGMVAVYDRAGLFNAEVKPGQSIDLTLALPALPKPGRYRLLVDMRDEQHCWFHQTGSEPLELELEVD
jgi:protein tyrosine phosphatase (PTP) superfamily phosphohydrolase (DUF442 family)